MLPFSILEIHNTISELGSLAISYKNSYNNLSKNYKTPEEMKLYTYGYFLDKLKKIASDEKSFTFVLSLKDDKGKMVPKGFIRYSMIPDYYKSVKNGISSSIEKGILDGHAYEFERKIKFDRDVSLTDKTVAINQIYLDPSIQSQGYGTKLLANTLPVVKEKGFKDILIEYNKSNKNACKFYTHVLCMEKIAETEDLDHILEEKGDTKKYISDVHISYGKIDKAIESVRKIDRQRDGETRLVVFTKLLKQSR